MAAGPRGGGRPTNMRPGDWVCPSCNNHNYADKIRCNRCKVPKAEVFDPYTMGTMRSAVQGMAGMMQGMQGMSATPRRTFRRPRRPFVQLLTERPLFRRQGMQMPGMQPGMQAMPHGMHPGGPNGSQAMRPPREAAARVWGGI